MESNSSTKKTLEFVRKKKRERPEVHLCFERVFQSSQNSGAIPPNSCPIQFDSRLVLECEIAGKQDPPKNKKKPHQTHTLAYWVSLKRLQEQHSERINRKPKNTLPTTTTTNCSRLLQETELKISEEKNKRKESKSQNNSYHKKRKKERKRGSKRRRLKLKQSLNQQHKQKYNNKIT